MLNAKLYLRSLLMVASLATQVIITGCSARVGVAYRAYDPYYRDYHVWDDHEIVYYDQWARETHRDQSARAVPAPEVCSPSWELDKRVGAFGVCLG
jgi:hypothetical protein